MICGIIKPIKKFLKKKNELPNEKLKKIWLGKNNEERYQDKIAHREVLHQNTQELIFFVDANNIMPMVSSIHEIGCGSGRNLRYIKQKFNLNNISYSGNDLSKEACFHYMDDELKKVLTFYEQDTFNFLNKEVHSKRKADLLLSSDHLMHLGRDIIEKVYSLMAQFAEKYILLREPYGASVRITDGFVWASDLFEEKFPGFTLVDYHISKSSTRKKEFRLMLFKKRNYEPTAFLAESECTAPHNN